MKKLVGIIYGGQSVEHDISILTALQVYYALDKTKHDVELFYINREGTIIIGENLPDIEAYKNNDFKNVEEIIIYQKNNCSYYQPLNKRVKKAKNLDVLIVCVHGYGVEDGTIAGLLNFLNVPNTAPSILSSSIAQDKELTKIVLNHYNIATLPSQTIYEYEEVDFQNFNYPLIIKPASLGSSIGIIIARNKENLENGLKTAFKLQNKLIVETLLESYQEFNCACFKANGEYHVSLVEEVTSDNAILTFNDKYQESMAKRYIPALISAKSTTKIKETTKEIYQKLNFFGVIRVDYLYDKLTNQLYVNEINTIPGSLAYYLFSKDGISFTQMLEMLIKEALLRKEQDCHYNNRYITNLFDKRQTIGIKK